MAQHGGDLSKITRLNTYTTDKRFSWDCKHVELLVWVENHLVIVYVEMKWSYIVGGNYLELEGVETTWN